MNKIPNWYLGFRPKKGSMNIGTSVERANGYYGAGFWEKEAEAGDPASSKLLLTLQLSPQNLLNEIIHDIDASCANLGPALLAVVNNELLQSIDKQLTAMGDKAMEQLAAHFLREKFGTPNGLLAVPVFADLAQKETFARRDTQTGAQESLVLLDQVKTQVIAEIQLLIADQINQLDQQIKQLQEAKTTSQAIAKKTPEISDELQEYQPQFTKEFNQLEQHKLELQSLFKAIARRFDTAIDKQTIFETAGQSTNPLPLAA